jgi:hypothetical protein
VTAPLTDTEKTRVLNFVREKLKDRAEVYNKGLVLFQNEIREYVEALASNPEKALFVAGEINKGNYSSRSTIIRSEMLKSIPTLRQWIILDMKAKLVKNYSEMVSIPEGEEHYDSLLPQVPKN